jgi:4-hydroxybenzoate polyprenyltransferase
VEPSDTSGRAPVIALHGMPSRRSELASDAPVASEQPGRAVAAEPAPVATPLPRHGIWAWLELTRISNVLTVATNAIVGLWVAHLLAGQATIERFIDWMPRHVGVVAGLCLLYLFGMVLNDLLDRDVDAHERPARPLPSGRVAMRPAILLAATLVATGVWLVGGGSFPVPGLAAIAIGLAFGSFAKGQRNAIQWLGEAWAVVGVGAILWNWLDHWRHADLRTPWGFEAVLLLVATIVAYSFLHRTWRGSVVLMGLCRALAYWCATLSVMSVAGMQYNGSSVSAWGLVLFPGLIAFASTIAVSLLARDEAVPTDDAAVVAPQPTRVWVRVLLVAAMLVPWAFSPVVAGGARGMLQVMTIVALPMALFCGGIFLVKSLHAERAMRSHPTRIAGGVAAWIAAFCLLDASTLSVLGAPGLSVVALGCWWITRTAQRRVAGS